jgi:hypothetical protein
MSTSSSFRIPKTLVLPEVFIDFFIGEKNERLARKNTSGMVFFFGLFVDCVRL